VAAAVRSPPPMMIIERNDAGMTMGRSCCVRRLVAAVSVLLCFHACWLMQVPVYARNALHLLTLLMCAYLKVVFATYAHIISIIIDAAQSKCINDSCW